MDQPDLTGAEIYAERGPSIALGRWHVVAGPDGAAVVYFVPNAAGTPQKAIIALDMLLDESRFTRIA